MSLPSRVTPSLVVYVAGNGDWSTRAMSWLSWSRGEPDAAREHPLCWHQSRNAARASMNPLP